MNILSTITTMPATAIYRTAVIGMLATLVGLVAYMAYWFST